MFADLVKKTRSYRRFDNAVSIERATLEGLVDLARISSSGGNLQPLKYILSCDAETNAKIFPTLRWAGYLKDWKQPEPAEQPTGYIVILRDNEITTNFVIDHGIAVQTMKLAAADQGLGGCIIGTVDRPVLKEALEIAARYEILLVLAVGKPIEEVVLEDVKDGDIRYYRDDKQVQHVPKRTLNEVILG